SCTHFWTPLWQTPVPHLPLEQQLAPEPGTSSTMPLQSSSRPLHTSVPLSVNPTHCSAVLFAVHCSVPPLQMPVPQGTPAGQQAAVGPVPPVQTSAALPGWQDSEPFVRRPVPQRLLPAASLKRQHAFPMPGTSSVLLLQSSSIPLHTSVAGSVSPTQESAGP